MGPDMVWRYRRAASMGHNSAEQPVSVIVEQPVIWNKNVVEPFLPYSAEQPTDMNTPGQ